MVLPLLRLGPKVSQRDVAVALEEIERYLNKVRDELRTPAEPEEPSEPSAVEWSSILGVPGTFPPVAHIHPDSLGVVQHRDDPIATRPAYNVVLWIGTVPPLGEEEGGFAKGGDLLLLLNFME